jgi:lipopolysaccharide export system protein LptA
MNTPASNIALRRIGLFLIRNPLLFLLGYFPAIGQTGDDSPPSKPRIIEIRNAEMLTGEKIEGKNIQKLIGRVLLYHDGAFMFCDSAYILEDENAMKAFGRIHIKQGDTLSLYGDQLEYNGNTRIAEVTGRVRLIDQEVSLNTEKLVYDRNSGSAYYAEGGNTISGNDNITSQKGYYYTATKEFAFKGDVVFVNPDYTLYSDTLIQNTQTDIAYFKGPSRIVSKENTIVCENGWYDKANDIAQFNRNATITSGKNILTGDSIYYERKRGYGRAIGSISIIDTVEKVEVTGNFAESFQHIEKYMVTDSAQMIQAFEHDSLFTHADTLLALQDSMKRRIIHAYRHAKFFKPDLQGSCDSLVYTESDSLMRMFGNPVLWNLENQITGEFIWLMMSRGKLYKMRIEESAMIVSELDSTKYNQISGREMTGFFNDANELTRVDVFHNGKSIYFPEENDGSLIGLNEVTCENMEISIENRQVVKIVFLNQPIGTMHPLESINPKTFRLPGFNWQIGRRPANRWQIFSPDPPQTPKG